jgi:uncharacterized protein (TIGR00297 family)
MGWQSWLVLAVVVPWSAFTVVYYVFTGWSHSLDAKGWAGATATALAISAGLALLVFLARAATSLAAVTGGIITAVLTLGNSLWYRSALPALLTLFVLTFAATRFGRGRKQQLGVAEDKRGRNAAQVAANLGAAGLGATLSFYQPTHRSFCAVVVIAALAEATADTLSSELGEVLGGSPLLVTNLRRVPAGTDGAISAAGTAAGVGGAAVIVLIAALTMGLTPWQGLAAGTGAVAGLFFDSLLGATAERSGWLNNDAVNFVSTLAGAVVGFLIFVLR